MAGANKHGCISNTVRSFDFYGTNLNFTFHGSDKFSTCVGTVITFFSLVLMISFTVNRSMKLVSKDDPFFSSLSMSSDEEEIDLGNLKYMFALENIDPRIGRLVVEQVYWGTS